MRAPGRRRAQHPHRAGGRDGPPERDRPADGDPGRSARVRRDRRQRRGGEPRRDSGMSEDVLIRRVSRVEACCRPMEWAWAEQNRDLIEANWRRRTADKPKMFNGRVMLLQSVEFDGDVCRNVYFETDYADFVAWIDNGYPDRRIANGFAMGALRGSDGAFICGVMSGDTVNAGRIYFAAGTPDLDDLRPDGTVDLATSLTRELHEETGLETGEYRVEDEWIIVQRWPTVALLRLVT